MKKILSIFFAVIMLFVVASCNNNESTSDKTSNSASESVSVENSESVTLQNKTFKIGVVDGAPSLVVANLCDGFNYFDDKYNYSTEIEITNTPQNIIAGFANKTYDMAIVPLNLAATAYNKNLGVKLATVNIFGVLYMVGREEITDLNKLKGEVVYSVGAGGTPEIVFKHVLTANNIKFEDGIPDTPKDDTVYINTVSAASEAIAALKTKKANYAILGEPVVTQAIKNTGTVVALDLQKEFSKIHNGVRFVQAGLVVKNEVAESGEYLNKLIEKMSGNKDYLYAEKDNVIAKIQSKGSQLKVALTKETLDRCLIGVESAKDLKTEIEAFLTLLDAKNYGGKIPDENFYLK